jgi:dTDP-4-amino-4,6-dideoxygalactose transaminase
MSDALAILGGAPLRSDPWPEWPEFGAPEREALERVLESRQWGGFPSPNTEARAFSEEFARFVGSRFAVPCANGTFSLTLALQAGRISRGAEVITTAYSFVGTAGGIVAAGGVPVPVDVLPDTYCIDPAAVEAAITQRTEAVMPVHLACAMADMDRLVEICERRGLLLVEDCAHAHGLAWRGRGAGSIGDFGSFSMQSSKLLTSGEGGCITTSDELGEGRLQALVNCGRRETPRSREVEQMFGHNLRMTEWQAALLREQLRRLPEQNERRRTNVARFLEQIRHVPGLDVPKVDARISAPTYYQLILRYRAEAFADVARDAVILALRAEGVPCSGRFYVPLNEDPLFALDERTNPVARARDYVAERFPIARRAAYDESIWLPHHLFLGSDADVQDVVAAFAKVQAHAAQLR